MDGLENFPCTSKGSETHGLLYLIQSVQELFSIQLNEIAHTLRVLPFPIISDPRVINSLFNLEMSYKNASLMSLQ